MEERVGWIDQLKGFGIFLVVYGHNFPFTEKYIYSFHMPLFFIIAGVFHPSTQNYKYILKRIKNILVPYFMWSFFLFLFWFILGRFYGESVNYNLSAFNNFIGIFYAQGGPSFMDWGIPMWFLPTIFLTFLTFYLIQLIRQKYLKLFCLLIVVILGFFLPRYFNFKFIWSLDVALVSLIFYAFGFQIKTFLAKPIYRFHWLSVLTLFIIHLSLFNFNTKIDMYRSNYGNEFLFILNGIIGTLFYIQLFRSIPKIKVLSLMGKFTIPILALQIRALTFIKFCLIIIFGVKFFDFTELAKFILAIFQIILIVSFYPLINKFIPILNGSRKNL